MGIIFIFSPEKLVTGKKGLAKYRFFFQTMGNIVIMTKFVSYTYLEMTKIYRFKEMKYQIYSITVPLCSVYNHYGYE